VAEADPDDRPSPLEAGAQESLERRDPGVILVDGVPRAGDDPAVSGARIGGCLPAHEADGLKPQRRVRWVEEVREHRRVIAVNHTKILWRLSRLQNPDPHAAAPIAALGLAYGAAGGNAAPACSPFTSRRGSCFASGVWMREGPRCIVG
jgi:hypothetical protein